MRYLLTILIICLSFSVFGANRFYKSSATVWNNANSWSATSSSGVDNAGIPTSSDAVTFDAGSANCSLVTTTGVCVSVDFTNYTHTITMSVNINVSGNITLGTGATFSGAGQLVSASSGTLTSNGKVLTVPYTVSGGVTVTIAGGNNWIMSNTVTLNSTSVINTTTSEQFECRGTSTSIANALTTGGGTATILLSGSGSVTGGTNNNFTINTSGTYNFGSFTFKTGIWTYTSGTVNFSTNLFTILGTCTLNTGAIQFYDVSITNFTAGTVTLNSTLNVSHNFTFNVSLVTSLTFAGSAGFNVANFINSMTGTQAIILTHGNTYTVTTSFTSVSSTPTSHGIIKSDAGGSQANLILSNPSTCSIGYLDATDINSNTGRTINTFKGTLSNTSNWNSYTDCCYTIGTN